MTVSMENLEAARLVLSRLGVDPADLRPPMPTLGEWIPVVAGLVSPSTAGRVMRKSG